MNLHRRILRPLVVQAVIGVLVSTAGGAQQLHELPVGARIRVHHQGWTAPVTGALAATPRDTIRVARVVGRDTLARDTLALALDGVRKMYVAQMPARRPIARNALRGFVVGAVVGGAVGATMALGNREDAEFFSGVAGTTGFFAALGAVPGVVIGAATGLARQDVWVRVPLR